MLQVARIFGNDMVLQQGKVLPVWGTAAPGAQVTVTVQGKSASATAGEDGAWIAQCGPLQVSFQETMVVSSQGETKTYTGVQVGEVWLAGWGPVQHGVLYAPRPGHERGGPWL